MKKIVKTMLMASCLLISACSNENSTTTSTSSTSSSTTEKKQQLVYEKYDIVTFQPFYNEISGSESSVPEWKIPAGFTNYNQLVGAAATFVSNKIDSITFDSTKNYSKNEVLKPELFSKLGKNQIILFEGHGSYEKFYEDETEMHSVMWTGQDYDQTKKDTDQDYIDYNLIPAGFLGFKEAITSNFIEKYVGDLTGSIIYLGNCFSAREATFADAFLQKGAVAVIGNTLTTQSSYNSLMMYKTITTMSEINQETNKTYTLYEALCIAKNLYGQTDKEKYPVSYGSRPTIFGNPNFCLSKLI